MIRKIILTLLTILANICLGFSVYYFGVINTITYFFYFIVGVLILVLLISINMGIFQNWKKK